MTRRKFIQKAIGLALAVAAGAWSLAKQVAPRKFVRAVKLNKFPGLVKPLQKIKGQAKWSG